MSDGRKETERISLEIKGKVAIISLNIPRDYNALTFGDYQRLAAAVDEAANHPDTVFTVITSTGKFFSSGANVKGVGGRNYVIPEEELKVVLSEDEEKNYYYQSRAFWSQKFAARNLTVTNSFIKHPKILVIALNGPVIGLSAALVATADLIYALDSTFLLTPFANLGLVAEGASSYTLVQRLGLSKANEALLFSRPIPAKELKEVGFINVLYPASQFSSAEDFNAHVLKDIHSKADHLVPESILGIKKLIRLSFQKNLVDANHEELIAGTNLWAKGYPQDRFSKIAAKSIKHKL